MQPVPQITLHFCRISCRSDFQYTHTQITCSILIFFFLIRDLAYWYMLYLFFNLQAWGLGDQSSGATRNKSCKELARFMVVVVVVVGAGGWGWVFSCNSGNTFINSKKKDINCNVLLSIQSMDKNDREWMFFRLLDSSIVCTLVDWARPCVTLEGSGFGWFRVIVPLSK